MSSGISGIQDEPMSHLQKDAKNNPKNGKTDVKFVNFDGFFFDVE